MSGANECECAPATRSCAVAPRRVCGASRGRIRTADVATPACPGVCEHAVDLGWLPKLAAAHAPRDARQAFRQARAQLKRTTAGDYCASATLHDL